MYTLTLKSSFRSTH